MRPVIVPGIFLFVLWCANLFAQTQRCHTDEYFEALKSEFPDLESRVENARAEAFQYIRHHKHKRQQRAAIITIPVVVHVMHNGQAVGSGTNISDAQIFSQIEVLNEDYRALNTDISDVPVHFDSLVGDVEIQFCLASFDPEGNITNGIDRIDMGPGGTWSDSRKSGTIWDNSKYLNIWTANIQNGTLGYATFPQTNPNFDGVVVDYRYFGRTPDNPFNNDFNLGRTATHEIGHWLGLEHTFTGGCAGNNPNNCNSQGDRICDTPPTASANYGCPKSPNQNSCTEFPVDLPDMWMNYMDYMDDDCLIMFTKEQVALMRAVLNTSRATIKNSLVCNTEDLFTYSGQVVDKTTGLGVAQARVLFNGTTFQYETITDNNGNFSAPNFRVDTYEIYAGKWGYLTNLFLTGLVIEDITAPVTIPIRYGYYYDDFVMGYEWTIAGNATSGIWERSIPIGTYYNGLISNPDQDVAGDFGLKCFVTGNGGGSAGNDDVDDGNMILTSPGFDLSGYADPYVSYYRWFFNDGGQGTPPDDELIVSISNGNETIAIEVIDANTPNTNQWNFKNIRVWDYIIPTSNMHFIFETADLPGNGHLVEAGLDMFMVTDGIVAHPNGEVISFNAGDTVVINPGEPGETIIILTENGSIIINPGDLVVINPDGSDPDTILMDLQGPGITILTGDVVVINPDGVVLINPVFLFSGMDDKINSHAGELKNVRVYPNPTTGSVEIDIELRTAHNADVLIFNNIGQLIATRKLSNVQQGRVTFDLSGYPSGMYLIQLRTAQNTVTRKINLLR